MIAGSRRNSLKFQWSKLQCFTKVWHTVDWLVDLDLVAKR